jgi:NAD+ synthase
MGLNVRLDAQDATQALTRFIRDHVEDAGASGVILGLSSGLDSATAAALAVKALGPERVDVVFMPAATTPDGDREEAQALAEHLGLQLDERSVDAIVEATLGVVGERDRDTIANASARARMVVLYALARERKALVLGTSNKSELLVGYFTKYGDGGSDLLPLGDLYKTQVRVLAEHLGLPEFVRTKPPSAGLWEGQTDEQDLGVGYEALDRVLLGMELGMQRQEIVERAGVDQKTVDHVDSMRRRSEHKRQMARVCKIGIRSLTSDWRRSVTEGGGSGA